MTLTQSTQPGQKFHYPIYLLISIGLPRNHHSLYVRTSSSPPPSTSSTSTTSETQPGDASETKEKEVEKGYIYQVSGNIQNGMVFNHRICTGGPENEGENGFLELKFLGWITKEDFDCDGGVGGGVEERERKGREGRDGEEGGGEDKKYGYGRIRKVIESVEVPKKQFDGAKRLFLGEKLRRCQEWTREVVDVLRREGVLVEGRGEEEKEEEV